MTHATMATPVGELTLFEEDGHLVAIDWGRATGGGESPLLAEARRQLDQYFAGTRRAFELPLAPAGSPFQTRVWRAMQRIPLGRTRSYGEIASELGSSARAVGTACGRNPLPILIPCHRVLGAGGALGGYSGGEGLPTKRWLLAHERGGAGAP